MMDDDKRMLLRDLAQRVRTEDPSKDLDAEIAEAVGHRVKWHVSNGTMDPYAAIYWQTPHPRAGMKEPLPRFTTSIDAAAALMPEGWHITIEYFGAGWEVNMYQTDAEDDDILRVRAPTLPRAWTAASLLAREAELTP